MSTENAEKSSQANASPASGKSKERSTYQAGTDKLMHFINNAEL